MTLQLRLRPVADFFRRWVFIGQGEFAYRSSREPGALPDSPPASLGNYESTGGYESTTLPAILLSPYDSGQVFKPFRNPQSELRMSMPLPKSPELMRPDDTGLLVIDVQERLLTVQPDAARTVWNIRRLLDGAKILGVRTACTEQYPEKLGPTAPELAERLTDQAASKLTFSCGSCGEIFDAWREGGIHRVLVCGIETHVCVQQTVLDLLAAGYQTLVAADAVGARHEIDHQYALRRMEASGALLTTTEAALFEWCHQAGTAEFKEVSKLAKETTLGEP